MDLKTYNKRKQEVENLRKEADRVEGALAQEKKTLGSPSIEEAQRLLTKKEKHKNSLAKEVEKYMQEFDKQWANKTEINDRS